MATATAKRCKKPVRSAEPVGAFKELRAYEAQCKRIGFEPEGLDTRLLRAFLAEHGILDYDRRQVANYLNHVAMKTGTRACYVWRPLRRCDVGIIDTIYWWWHNRHNSPHEWATTLPKEQLYGQLIPSSVLETVEMIAKELPDAHFFVSEVVDDPDPFLGVAFKHGPLLIVDWWGEPDYKPTVSRD